MPDTIHPALRAVLVDLDPDGADALAPTDEWTLSVADLVRVFEAGQEHPRPRAVAHGLTQRMRRVASEAAELLDLEAADIARGNTTDDGEWSGEAEALVDYENCRRIAAELWQMAGGSLHPAGLRVVEGS